MHSFKDSEKEPWLTASDGCGFDKQCCGSGLNRIRFRQAVLRIRTKMKIGSVSLSSSELDLDTDPEPYE